MMLFVRNIGLLVCVGGLLLGCKPKAVPLDEKQFTRLLIDIHRIDGALSVYRGRGSDYTELKNYEFYNDVFRKYRIDRSDFDSCMYYYSAQSVLFSKMYDVVVDTLHKQLTAVDIVLNKLKAKDSVNYFPISDTLKLDSIFSVTVDSIVPGLYKFGATVRFDSAQRAQRRRIRSCFLSADGTDTLWVRDLVVNFDTVNRPYNWSQYVDSAYNRLVITFMDTMSAVRRSVPSAKGRKPVPEKKEVPVDLGQMGGKAGGIYLYRPYVSRETEKRLKQALRRR